MAGVLAVFYMFLLLIYLSGLCRPLDMLTILLALTDEFTK
jgi:uncharacterized membrane protein YozB (DUF420 family)